MVTAETVADTIAPPRGLGHLAGPRHPADVMLVQQRGATGGGHQQRAETDQATARAFEGDDRASGVAGAQVGDAPLARREFLRDGADVLVGHVAHATLLRLEALAVDFLGDDFRPADLQLVALATHRFDQHGQLQLAAAGDLDDVGRAGLEQA